MKKKQTLSKDEIRLKESKERELKLRPKVRQEPEIDEEDTALYNELSVRISRGEGPKYDLDSSSKKKKG